MAVDLLPAAAHRSPGGNGAAATPAFPISSCSSTLLVPASAAIGLAASTYCLSTLLTYYATFAASLVCFARAVWPDRVDAALAGARQEASLARADLETDLRRLGDYAAARAHAHPAFTAAAEECALRARATIAGWRRRAAARWDEHRDAACAARFLLRVIALVARLAATVVFDAACDEARACAPSVLAYLRSLADGIRPPTSSSCNNGGEDDETSASAGGFVLKDVVCLVGTGFYALFTLHLLFSSSAASGMQFCAVCFAATCGLTMAIADWIDPSDDDADETDTAAAGTDGSSRDEGDAAAGDGEASRDEELEVRQSWRFLWVLVLVTYCVDAFILHVTLGPKPATLAILALYNWEVLKVGRQVQLAPDGIREGAAEGSSPQGVVDGAVDKWRRGAMVVYAACSVKIFIVYLVLDCYLAALGFLWLFVMADLLLAEEDSLSDFDISTTSGEEDDEDVEDSAGFEGNVTGADEEKADDEAREQHSNTSSSSEHSQEEDHDIVDDEQQDEEPDYDSGGSTDNSWDLVDIDDPEMPAKAHCCANRKSRLFSMEEARGVISPVDVDDVFRYFLASVRILFLQCAGV